MELWQTKLICIFAAFVVPFLSTLLPIKVNKVFQTRGQSDEYTSIRISSVVFHVILRKGENDNNLHICHENIFNGGSIISKTRGVNLLFGTKFSPKLHEN